MADRTGNAGAARALKVPSLTDTLPALQRLSLAYATAAARDATLALFAFDTRLAAILRAAREPMMAQLRLAWWREQMRVAVDRWPTGEPLLTALRCWAPEVSVLATLVDGWEAMTGPPPLGPEPLGMLAAARGGAFAALARLLGADRGDEAARAGTGWALADLAGRLSRPEEREAAGVLIAAHDWRRARLPRSLRPLAVLHGLAADAVARGEALTALPPRTMITIMRIGLLGR